MSDRIVIEERGARGFSAAEELAAGGIIDAPTAEALDTHLRAPALEAAEQADADVAAAILAAGQAVTELTLDVDTKITQTEAARVGAITAAASANAAATNANQKAAAAQGVVDAGAAILAAAAGASEDAAHADQAATRAEIAAASNSNVYETTAPTAGVELNILDAGGRVLISLPDPRVPGIIATANTGSIYETTDTSIAQIMLDVGGRIAASMPSTSALIAAIGANTGAIFETTDANVSMLALDAGGRIIAIVPSQAAVAASTPTTVAEVVAARGNAPSLSARLANVVTADAAPIVDRYGRPFLRQCHYRLARRSLPVPEAVQLVINLAGDSYTHNPGRWSGPFADYMTSKYGDAGGGWCGFGFGTNTAVAPWTLANQPNFPQGNARSATYPTRHIGNGVGTYYVAASPDLARLTMAVGDLVYQAFPATPIHNGCDLFFEGSAAGVVAFSWGVYTAGDVANPASYTFGAATALPVQGTLGAAQIADIKAGMPAGAGMLKIECTAGAPQLTGVYLKSAVSGVRVNKIAATGSAIPNYVNAPAGFDTAIAALGAHAVVFMDGTNSQSNGVAPTTWGNSLAALVNRFRAASPGIDVLVATPPENQRTTNTVPMTAYAIEARKRAVAMRFAFVDMQTAFGDPANPGDYGATGAVPLYVPDLIHPDPATGGRLLLSEFVGMVEPF